MFAQMVGKTRPIGWLTIKEPMGHWSYVQNKYIEDFRTVYQKGV